MDRNGMSRAAIGRRFDVSRELVRQILGNYKPGVRYCLWCRKQCLGMRVCCTNTCYQNWHRHNLSKIEHHLDKFASNIAPPNDAGCWEWQASCNPVADYGNTHWDNKRIYAHRLMWRLVVGKIPPGALVLHKCDNPRCVNPHHLFLGSHRDNAKDRESKGRGNRTHRFSKGEVDKIRASYQGNGDLQKMACKYGVTKESIWRVVTHRTYQVWKYLTNVVRYDILKYE